MDGQLRLQHLLRTHLLEKKKVNPSFSIRALAKKIQMQPSATNEIIRGERQVSRKIAERIANNLILDPTEKSLLLAGFPQARIKQGPLASSDGKNELNHLKLSSDQFSIISESIHYAILSLIKTKNFQSDINWIAERLDSTVTKVKSALKKLEYVGLIKTNETGTIIRTTNKLYTSDGVRDLSIKNSHLNDMEIAKEKLTSIDVKDRDFTSLTLPSDPRLLSQAQEIIRDTQNRIESLMEEGDKSEVYKLCVYFYPLTNVTNKKELQ